VSWSDNAKVALRAVIGLVIAAAAFYTGWVALHQRPIDAHLVEFSGCFLLLAGLVIDFDPVFTALKNLASLVPMPALLSASKLAATERKSGLTEAQILEENHGD